MIPIVCYLLMPQKYINSKQKILKKDCMCLENVSEDFLTNNMKITGLNGFVNSCDFSVDCRALGASKIINIYKYLMKKHN